MLWILFAGAIAFLTWYICIKPFNHFTKLGVKQTKPWPILGDNWVTLLRVKSIAEMTEWIYHMHPKTRYTGLYQFLRPALMIKDPELIKQITVKDFDHFTDHSNFVDPEADPLWSGNLFSLTGQRWREMRATLSGTFTSSKMKHVFGIINESAEHFVKFFMDKNQDLVELELKDTFTRYTNDVIASAAFGIKVDSSAEPDNLFYKMGRRVTDFSGLLKTMKFILVFLTPKLFKIFKIGLFDKDITHYFKTIINETIEVREQKGIIRQDMINVLLEVKKGINKEETYVTEPGFAAVKESNHLAKYKFKQLKTLTNDEITSQALIFFLAGFDTISTALCFGTYELVANKEVQEKLRQEIVETHEANNGKLTYDVLLKMKYMDMVFAEILRKCPPPVLVDRVCTKPYVIEPVYADEKPIPLKINDVILLPLYSIQRDPKYYPDPEKFDPERFSDENKDSIKPYTYIPFGSGPRNCIGSRFAMLEAKALLYHLLLNFEVVPTKKTRIPLKLCRKSVQHTVEGGFWFGFQRIKQ